MPREQLQPVVPAGQLPQYRTRPSERFWFEPIAGDPRGLYVAFRGYDDFGKHARALLTAIDSGRPQYVVIDLRQNSGGDFTKPRKQLIPQLKQRGYTGKKLFVITGRRTFSAAMVNAIDLRNLLGATLVGEPPGEKPNSYQENDEMVLPRSKIVISYSTRYYTFLEPDADAPWSRRKLRGKRSMLPTGGEMCSLVDEYAKSSPVRRRTRIEEAVPLAMASR